MEFVIDSEIFEKFPGLVVGVVTCKNINNKGDSEELHRALREQENRIRTRYSTETLSQMPNIGVWRKAYSAFGAKPKENKSSVESLYRLVLQGAEVRHINVLVDAYNLVSLRYMVPVGGEDIDKTHGSIRLTFAESQEPAVLLLGDKEPRPPHAGEVIYRDDVSVICRRWNWRETDRTKLSEETRNCVLVIEGLPPVSREEIERATEELKEIVKTCCGGDISSALLDENDPKLAL